jgi:D-sedoheptulose 7-phosphate isomerase
MSYCFRASLKQTGQAGDFYIAISTSGNSKNVIKSLESAKKMGIKTIGLTGKSGR